MNKSNLSKLASYYLEVLSHDESAEPSAFAKNMYGNPGYVELPFFPGLTSNIESEDLTEYGRSARSYWNGKKKQEACQQR